MTLNDPYPQFQGHAILWRWTSHKRYDIQTQFQWNTNRELHKPRLNSVISNDLEWLSKIFNDAKRRAVSLQQLSFLLKVWWWCLPKIIKTSPCLSKPQLVKVGAFFETQCASEKQYVLWNACVPLPNFCENCSPTKNFTEIRQLAELWLKNNFNMAIIRHLHFEKLIYGPVMPSSSQLPALLLYTKFYRNRVFFVEVWQFNDFQDVGRPPFWILGVQEWVLWKAHLVFEKIAFLCTFCWQTDRQTDGQQHRVKPLSRAVALQTRLCQRVTNEELMSLGSAKLVNHIFGLRQKMGCHVKLWCLIAAKD